MPKGNTSFAFQYSCSSISQVEDQYIDIVKLYMLIKHIYPWKSHERTSITISMQNLTINSNYGIIF
jgi:hypothetical protein